MAENLEMRIQALELAARVNAAGDEERLRRVIQAEQENAALKIRVSELETSGRETTAALQKRLRDAETSIELLTNELRQRAPTTMEQK